MKSPQRKDRAAFTLLEVMAVITIIVILAVLAVIGLSAALEKHARSKAIVQVALITKALEEYNSDMGTYPVTANSSDAVSGNNSQILYEKLFYEGYQNSIAAVPDPAKAQKIYLPELDPRSSKQGWVDVVDPATPPPASVTIKDPWSKPYAYRTAKSPAGTPNPLTLNPGFDLWSRGKDGNTNTAVPADTVNRDDIKNFLRFVRRRGLQINIRRGGSASLS